MLRVKFLQLDIETGKPKRYKAGETEQGEPIWAIQPHFTWPTDYRDSMLPAPDANGNPIEGEFIHVRIPTYERGQEAKAIQDWLVRNHYTDGELTDGVVTALDQVGRWYAWAVLWEEYAVSTAEANTKTESQVDKARPHLKAPELGEWDDAR